MLAKIRDVFGEGSPESFVLGLVYPLSLVISAIGGSVFLKRIPKTRFFRFWIVFGIFTSICSALAMSSSFFVTVALTSTLGISVGLGMPLCLGYFAESISVENRGKTGGIILFATFFSAATFGVLTSMLDLTYSASLLALWRAWILPLMFFVTEKQSLYDVDIKTSQPFSSVFHNKAFGLYFVAWLMFTFVNSFEGVVVQITSVEFQFFVRIIEPAVAGFSALIAGIVSDWAGRKRVLIFGFVSLGIAYATIGLLFQSWMSLLFYFVMDGIAIGSLWVLFVMVLWGDLSPRDSEKFYAIGETPFFLTEILYFVLTPYLASIPTTGAFSLAAFFLFLAVLPLLYAPETLPEKSIRERELRLYIDKAKKAKQEYA
jgi:MFS family permease